MTTPANRARAAAFTLVEVAIAIALVGVVAAAGTTIVLQLNRSLQMQAARLRADDEAKQLAEWLVFEARGVGGDALRPWEAVEVHRGGTAACAAVGDLPACDDSDRLVLTVVDNALGSCRLTGSSGVNLHATLVPPPGAAADEGGEGGAAGDVCCLDVQGEAVVPASPWESRTALLLDAERNVHVVRLANRTNSGSDNCAVNVPAGLPAALDVADIPEGQLVAGVRRVYFRAPADDNARGLKKDGLYEFTDGNVDGLFGAGELVLIADNVLDLQVALGHDRDADGRVLDRTSSTDEWLGNAVGDTLPATVERDALRMLGIGLVISVPLPPDAGDTSARVFDGPLRTAVGAQARATVTRAYMRNVFLFD